MNKNILTREQAAEKLQISISTLVNWEKRGILIPMRIGRRNYYYEEEIYSKLECSVLCEGNVLNLYTNKP